MPNADGKLNIAVDFDGVLHTFHWKGVDVFDDPIPGAVEAIQRLRAEGHTIILNTTRMWTPKLHEWLLSHGFVIDYYNENPNKPDNSLDLRKVLADVYVDDRGIQFNGNWSSTVEQILAFKPWFKRTSKEHHAPTEGDTYCDDCGLDQSYWNVYPICPASE
jgi:hypothetical protein